MSFHELDRSANLFHENDLYSDGYAWQRAVELFCSRNSIDISGIEFDSESDMFAAYSNSPAPLKAVAMVIERFVTKPETLAECLQSLEKIEDEWFTAEGFLEHLKLGDVDISIPQDIHFDLIFNDEKQAQKACHVATLRGYRCYFGLEYDDYPIVVIVNTLLSKKTLEDLFAYFSDLGEKTGGLFDHYDIYDEFDSLDDLEHWKRF
ncbi:MAG: hypothetical protein GY703_16040 [Gammaproteobacteria bacterium]|nr:hypothetical protein [Gammaproteobacteria bacterium]